MSYDELVSLIAERPKLPEEEYYSLLLDNADVITQQLITKTKANIASDLGMSAQVFSTALRFLKCRIS